MIKFREGHFLSFPASRPLHKLSDRSEYDDLASFPKFFEKIFTSPFSILGSTGWIEAVEIT